MSRSCVAYGYPYPAVSGFPPSDLGRTGMAVPALEAESGAMTATLPASSIQSQQSPR